MSEADIELARLLARFKLQVKRTLGRSVNLAAMTGDRAYAAATLDEVEELAEDEELLLLVIRLREGLALAVAVEVVAQPAVSDVVTDKPQAKRDYRFGARGG
ncbi:hypothetical protein J5J83_16630 [Azoarcus sp. L1K30]|uniref:hypothetical protein n=1 Tax=Azoarcus sp. L1K30 TaxID=2820277 RepID=UPI001B8269C7|nr:hypothetical protein [Azoarcus sp. L1K30]MBR0567752.1 hypothetical protein [Azoarcus sp. L1K30]